MDYLKLLVQQLIRELKLEQDLTGYTESEIFDIVHENLVSGVEHYNYSDFIKDSN